MDFNDKTVLVTGGTRGIGAAISRAFAEAGAKVALNYRGDESSARKTLEELPGSGHQLFKADIGKATECQSLVENVYHAFGKVEVLVNNAGIHERHPLERVDYENWNRIFQETFDVNLLAPARLMYLVASRMKADGGGNIVNISSRGAFRGEPDQPAYGASKAGLNALSQSLAQKLAPHGVFIGIVAPGFVETDLAKEILDGPEGPGIRQQSPFGRVARPEEVAYATMFLASEKARFSTGTILDVNGASYLRS